MTTGYQPLKVTAPETGLVQSREQFILPNDAYPVLENAYVWRERIKRKQGFELLGRLRRILTAQALGNTDGSGDFTGNIFSILTLEATAEIEVGSVVISDGTNTFTDDGLGILVGVPGGTGTINYVTGTVTISGGAIASPLVLAFNYYPSLPVMGLRQREQNNINKEQLVAFDTKYAYIFLGGWQEFIPGTTWTGNDSDFFWSTNYWISATNAKLFWVTNFSGTSGDPIRYTDGTNWFDFGAGSVPLVGIINIAGDYLNQCLCLLPFRGRLVAFNTWEGQTLATSVQYRQRIRWAAIGNPLIVEDLVAIPPVIGPWRDDVRGKGGFLDIPTSENIVSVGFVRDNLVIYCESSTWQLRYTGRTIAPFQIEKVNSELGAESTFSAVQFDTSLVGVGDKGIVECDSYKSERIDIKIPDLVFSFNNNDNGTKRVHGIRDFVRRLAYWVYPQAENNSTFPNRRLVYNYENDSWAIFTDSLTTLGTYQPQTSRRWIDYVELVSDNEWQNQNYPWIDRPSLIPAIVGGNQQGYVEFLDETVTNDVSLSITNITGNDPNPTVITSINHNLKNGQVIQITGIPTGTPFASSLNNGIFAVVVVNNDSFQLWLYDPVTQNFDHLPQTDSSGVYIGGGQIAIRDNFIIQSKKFNYMDMGRQFQLGYIDVLMDDTENGAISLNIYNDYNMDAPSNKVPLNSDADTFFNSIVPTNAAGIGVKGGTKNWQRVFCPTNSNFVTIEWTLSNAQMVGPEQESDVQIDAQTIWSRPGGRLGVTQ